MLKVHYPPDILAPTAVQKYYFDKTGLLKRLDYITDVLGGVAAHYTFDHKNVDGLIIPQLRRVVRRADDGTSSDRRLSSSTTPVSRLKINSV